MNHPKAIRHLLAVAAVLTLAAACGPSDAEVQTIVDERLAQALTAIPSPTSAPTATPTAVPPPTPTPTATPTPIPTATSTPEPTPTPTATGGAFPDIAAVVEQVGPAVVQILSTIEERNAFGQLTESGSQGSGVAFDAAGYILTNNHVVEDATKVEVVFIDRRKVTAEVVGTDPDTDLAVLKVAPEDLAGIEVATLGDTDAMRNGDWVIAIGSPLGFEGSVTVGVISAKGRTLTIDSNDPSLHDLVQTDAVINPGNSGGPLLNLDGEVIGINSAIIRGSIGNNQEAEGIGFAISMGTAIPVSRQLIENGRVVRPRIGVFIVDVTPASAAEQYLGVDHGVLVVAVTPGGAADRAGILVNDVIVEVDGELVTTSSGLIRLFLTTYRVGDSILITVVRGTRELGFGMRLEEAP